MQIKCPKCAVSYDLPEKAFPKEKMGNKPQKVRCFKCKAVFKVALRERAPQPTYEEYADILSRMDLEMDDMQQTVEIRLQRPSAIREPTQEENELILDVFDQDNEESQIDSTSIEVNGQSKTAQSPDLVARTSLWTTDKTLDLSGYTVGKEMMTIRRFSLVIATSIVLCLLGLLLFIAGRNGWSLSFFNLKDEITYAFFGDPQEDLPEELRGLFIKVGKRRTIVAMDKRRIVVVNGRVVNASRTPRKNVLIKAQIIDANGQVFRETLAPCGKVRSISKLQRAPKGEIDNHLKKGNDFYNCKVNRNSKRKFQILFDDIPLSYKAYTLDIKVVSASLDQGSPSTSTDQ